MKKLTGNGLLPIGFTKDRNIQNSAYLPKSYWNFIEKTAQEKQISRNAALKELLKDKVERRDT